MKKILWLLPVFMIGLLSAGISYTDLQINRTAQAVNFTQSIDLQEWSRFSLQAIYSAASLDTDTATDGTFATNQITITDYLSFSATKATNTVHVATTTGLSGESVTINGIVFTAGTDFVIGASSTSAALALSVAINATTDLLATASGATCTVTAAEVGTAANSWPVSTSDSSIMEIGGNVFGSGVAAETITINGITLTESVDWSVELSTIVTAQNIADAMMDNATLAATIISSATGNVIYSTSIVPVNLVWQVIASTDAFEVTNGGFIGGLDSQIVASSVTAASHGLTTGIGVLFGVSAGTAPKDLIDQTTYYVIDLGDNQYALATSTTNAAASVNIDISTFTGSGTFTFAPLAMTGAPSFKWQASNDETNWTDLALTSVTYSAAGNSLWDVGEVDYRYIRINFLAPTAGGLALDVYQSGKRD